MSEPRLQDNELLEELSAFIDGELDPERSRFLMQRLSHDAGLRARFERWQTLSSAIRRQGQPAPAGFAERIAGAIEAEAAAAPAVPRRRSRALRWGGGFALAASVAFAALFAWRATTVPAPVPVKPAVAAVAPAGNMPIQRTELPLPEPVVKLPIPVRSGVVTAFRSPARPILVRDPAPPKRPNFDPFPQPYAIDPELEAYLQSQKTGSKPGDGPGPAASNRDDAVRTVAWPEQPQR